MKRASFTVLFYPKWNKPNKDGTYPIYARVTINGERAEFSLISSILKQDWDRKRGCIKSNTPELKQYNTRLANVRGKLLRIKQEFELAGFEPTSQLIKNSYLGIEEEDRTILGIFREHNDWCKSLIDIDFAHGTWQRYETSYKHTSDFISYKYKKKDLPLIDISPIFIRDYEHYLKTVRKCGHNSTVKYIKNFNKIVRIALNNGWLIRDPFANVKFKLNPVDMSYLTEEELETIMRKNIIVERIALVRDVYVFCCFTGLAFVDVKSLKHEEIHEENGTYWIKKRRQKTKNWSHIPMLKPAIDIMNKYQNDPLCLQTGLVLPVYTNQKMNAYLKEIADICSIKKNLSTHNCPSYFCNNCNAGKSYKH